MNPLDRFKCDVLSCVLTRKACAERFVRASSLKIKEGTVEPSEWARYLPCRGCSIGARHSQELSIETPGHKRKMTMFGATIAPIAEAPEALPEGVTPRFTNTPRGVIVEVVIEGKLIVGGPHPTMAVAKRWVALKLVKR